MGAPPYNSYRRNVQGAFDPARPISSSFDMRVDPIMCPTLTISVDVVNVGCPVSVQVQVSFPYEETLHYLGTVARKDSPGGRQGDRQATETMQMKEARSSGRSSTRTRWAMARSTR